jgi:hypothetical protein
LGIRRLVSGENARLEVTARPHLVPAAAGAAIGRCDAEVSQTPEAR